MVQSSVSVAERNANRTTKQSKHKSLVLPAIVVIVGLLVMLYPVVSTAWNNKNASRIAQEYAQLEKDIPQETRDTLWENAHAYNEHRTTGPILDPWLSRVPENSADYAEYLDQLHETDAMARFIFPEIDVDLPLFHGTKEDTLQRGLGHLYGSDLPVGGEGTHSVITGHTGLSNSTMFDHLDKAQEGDAFYVQVAGHRLKYVVDQVKVVLPTETDDLRQVAGKDYITLITCTPYGINSHRLLVRGRQVPLPAEESEVFDKTHGAGWQWWMFALLAAVIILGSAFAWWVWQQRRKAALVNTPQLNTVPESAGDTSTESEHTND